MTQPAEDHLPEDETAAAPEPQQVAPDVASLKVAELEKKLAEMQDKVLRALADGENLRRRTEKERQDTAKFAVSSLARDLLPVVDNLRRALSAISPEARDKSPEFKNIYLGVESTERELLRVLESNGIRRVDPTGQKFDANFHEVMFEADDPTKPPGTVVQVIEPGYTIHERLLRPARVGVAKGGTAGGNGRVDTEV